MSFSLPPIPRPTAKYDRKPPTKLTPEQIALYLGHLSQTGLVVMSAKAAGVSRQAIVKLRDRDPQFKEDEADAQAEFAERLEAEVIRRGFEGYEEPLHNKGVLTGDSVTKYDSALAILAIKKVNPAYGERLKVDANVRAGVMLAPGTMDAASWVAAFGGSDNGDSATGTNG